MATKDQDISQYLTSFSAFYPYYLGEHRHPWTRRFHFFGTLCALGCIATALALYFVVFHDTQYLYILFGALFFGYFFAWVSHFFIEKNRPATFKAPFYSLAGDFRMFFELLFCIRPFDDPEYPYSANPAESQKLVSA